MPVKTVQRLDRQEVLLAKFQRPRRAAPARGDKSSPLKPGWFFAHSQAIDTPRRAARKPSPACPRVLSQADSFWPSRSSSGDFASITGLVERDGDCTPLFHIRIGQHQHGVRALGRFAQQAHRLTNPTRSSHSGCAVKKTEWFEINFHSSRLSSRMILFTGFVPGPSLPQFSHLTIAGCALIFSVANHFRTAVKPKPPLGLVQRAQAVPISTTTRGPAPPASCYHAFRCTIHVTLPALILAVGGGRDTRRYSLAGA